MEETEPLSADHYDSSASNSSCEEGSVVSYSSSDAGSEWTVPEPRQPGKCFAYIFHSDFETESLMRKISGIQEDSTDSSSIYGDIRTDAAEKTHLDSRLGASSVSNSSTDASQAHLEISLNAKTQEEIENVDTNSGDSDSLESLNSSEECSLESVDESDESDTTSEDDMAPASDPARVNPSLAAFGNHALLQYHFQKAQTSTGGKNQSNASAAIGCGSNSPTVSGYKRKRRRVSSSATSENNNVLVSTDSVQNYKKRIDLETSEDRDAYILQRVQQWDERGVAYDWRDLGLSINMTASQARRRHAELTGVRRRIDISTVEKENEYIVNTLERWHTQNKRGQWRAFIVRLGWTARVFRERLHQLLNDGKIEATHLPEDIVPKRAHGPVVLDTVEKQDQYILDRVASARRLNRKILWHNIARKLGWSTQAVKERFVLIPTGGSAPASEPHGAGSIAVFAEDTIDNPDIIDLTNSPTPDDGVLLATSTRRNLHQLKPSADNNLASYIIARVRMYSSILPSQHHGNNLSTLWRQLGVELGVCEAVFEEMWLKRLQALYIRDYGPAVVPGKKHHPPPPLQLTHEQCTWLCAQVYAWRGRGRGLWEGLSRVLNAPPVQVMCLWSMLTPVEVQQRWVEDAVSHSMQKIGVFDDPGPSTSNSNSSSSSSGDLRDYADVSPFSQSHNFVIDTIVTDDSADTDTYQPTVPANPVPVNVTTQKRKRKGEQSSSSDIPYAEQVEISQCIYKYYTDTSKVTTINEFWRSMSDQPLVLAKKWKQLCTLFPDSHLLVPVVIATTVRAFTPAMDAQLIQFVHTMRTRWGSTEWSIIAHGLASTVDVLRARWFCVICTNKLKLYRYVHCGAKGDEIGCVQASLKAMVDTVVLCVAPVKNMQRTFSAAYSSTIYDLVLDMVNTVSITAILDATLIPSMHHHMDKRLPATISVNHTSRLKDEDIALIIHEISAWNAGTSTYSSIANMWMELSNRLRRKGTANDLCALWRAMCRNNPDSHLIVWPVTTSISLTYVVSTFANLMNKQASQLEVLHTVSETPALKARWCKSLSQRSGDVYKVLQSQWIPNNSNLSSLYVVDECMEGILRAVSLTHYVDTMLVIPTSATNFVQDNIYESCQPGGKPVTLQHIEIPVRSAILGYAHCSPQRVSYTTEDARAYILHYMSKRRLTACYVNWPYLARRLKTSEASLRQIYVDFLVNRGVQHAMNVTAYRPVNNTAQQTISLDPNVMRWHEERVKVKRAPSRKKKPTLSELSPLSHNIQFVNPTGAPIYAPHGCVTPQPTVPVAAVVTHDQPSLHLELDRRFKQQQQQSAVAQAKQHIDQMIMHTARVARAAGTCVNWETLSQILQCPVPTLQSRYLFLLSNR